MLISRQILKEFFIFIKYFQKKVVDVYIYMNKISKMKNIFLFKYEINVLVAILCKLPPNINLL